MSWMKRVPGDLTIVHPLNNHIEFSCRQKSSAVRYWNQASGALDVDRALEGHSNYYVDPRPATQLVKPALLFSDWSAPYWNRDKIIQTLFLAEELLQKGYICWALDNETMQRMTSGYQLAETLIKNSNIVSHEALVRAAGIKGITRDKLRIIDYSELNSLLNRPASQKLTLYFSDLLAHNYTFSSLKERMGKLKKAHHSFKEIVCDYFPPEAFGFNNGTRGHSLLIQQIRDELGLPVTYQFRTMKLKPEMLANPANLEYEGGYFNETHWRTIELLEISGGGTNWSLPDEFSVFLQSMSTLKRMSLRKARNVNNVRLEEFTQQLESLDLFGTDVSNETLAALAPRLKHLNIEGCSAIQWDTFDYSVFSNLESIVPDSRMDLSALIKHAPHLKALDLSTFSTEQIREPFSIRTVETVFLGDNGISSAALANLLSDAPALKNLYLQNCKEIAAPFSCGPLPALQNLYLNNSGISSQSVENVLQNAPSLQRLVLCFCENIAEDFACGPLSSLIELDLESSRISSQSLENLLEKAPNLQRLALNGCRKILDDFTCGPLTSLTELALEFSKISSKSLENLLKKAPALQDLSIHDCSNIDSDFSCGPLHSLITLNASDSAISGKCLENLLKNAPNLIELNIDGCEFHDNWDFGPLSLSFLKRAYFARCTLSPRNLESLLEKASGLKVLDLYGYRNLGDDVDFNCGALHNLQELTLDESTISDKNLSMLLRDAPALKILSLIECHDYIGDSLTCGYLPALEKLSLSRTAIDSSSLKNLLMNTPALKELHMSGCGNIDIDFTCEPFAALETLDLSGSKISKRSLEHLVMNAPALKVLNLSECSIPRINFTAGALLALEVLHFSDSKISSQNLEKWLLNVPVLKLLDLSYCKHLTTDFTPGPLPALERLWLEESNISSRSLENLLMNAPALKVVDLSQCKHITADFMCGPLPVLEELRLAGSTISSRSLKCLLENAPALKTVMLDPSFLLSPELQERLRLQGVTIKYPEKEISFASLFPIAPISVEKHWDADTQLKNNTLQGKRIFYPLIPGGRSEPHIATYRLQTFSNMELNPECGINEPFRLYNDDNPELWEDVAYRHLGSLGELPTDSSHYQDLLGIQDFMLNDTWQPLASVSHLDQLTHLYVDPSDIAIEIKYSPKAQQYYIRKQGEPCHVRAHFVMQQKLDKPGIMSWDSLELCSQIQELYTEIKGYGSQELEDISLDWNGEDYLKAIRSQKQGACRHRAVAFMAAVKEISASIPVRIVTNDVHAFAEVVIEGYCYRYDLGGYTGELDIDDTNRPTDNLASSDSEESCSDSCDDNEEVDCSDDFEPQESFSYQHPWTELFERSLTTWEKATRSLTTVEAYCQNVIGNSDFKHRLIEMPSEEAVQELQCAVQLHCRKSQRPVFYIHSPDDLVCQASTVRVVEGNTGRPQKGPGGPLYDFLTQHAGSEEPPVLIVNYSTFSSDDLARFNTLLKKPRQVDGVAIPDDFILLGLTNTGDPEHNTDEDFYSLFKRQVEVCPLSTEQLAETRLALPFDTLIETPADGVEDDVFSINLFHALDWKARLVGRWVLRGNDLVAEEGLLVAALKSGKKIVLENAPWDDPDFQRFWRQTMIDQRFNTPCGPHPFPEGSRLQKKKQDGYDWQALSETIDFDLHYVSGAAIFNPLQLQKLFRSQECKDHALYTGPGLLKRHEGEVLHLNLTRALSMDEWAECLSRACELNVRLQVHLPPALNVPDFIAPYKTASSSSSPFSLSDDPEAHKQASSSVIVSNDPDTTVINIMSQAQPGAWTVLDVSECLPGDLVTSMKGEFKKELERFIFSEVDGILKTALQEGKSVLLTGTMSPILADALSAFMEERKKNQEPGNLLIVTDSANTFPWVPQQQYQVSDEEKRCWVMKSESATKDELQAIGGNEILTSIPLAELQARLRFIRKHPGCSYQDAWKGLDHLPTGVSLTPFNLATSVEESQGFHAKRLLDVTNILEYSPYVFLTGLTGVGKTTFVDLYLSRYGTVYHGESNISTWASDCSEGMKFLFIDEANLSSRGWSEFEGLFCNPPSIRINGVLHTLTSEHRVVFAGNPTSYSDDRHLAPFFARHGGTVLFDPLPLASIYEDVLKPMFEDSGLDVATVCAPLLAVYQFACEKARDEVLLTPRELQMMALCILSTLRDNPDGDQEAIAQYYAHAITEHTLPQHLKSLFNESFKSAEIPPEVMPQRMPEEHFKVTSSREPAFILLDSILKVRAFRQSLPDKDRRCLGGLGGMLLDGKPSIGNSSLIKAVLKMHHYRELGPNDEAPAEGISYYRVIPASTPAQEKEAALLRAFHEGAVVFMPGINSAPIKEDLLNGLLMGTDPSGNRAKKSGFVLLGTQGPITMPGRQAQSRALARRLITVSESEYTAKEMRGILRTRFPSLESEDAAALVQAFDKQLAFAKQHGFSPEPCFRDLVTLAQQFINKQLAENDELLNEPAPSSTDTILAQNRKRVQRTEGPSSSAAPIKNKRQRSGERVQPSRTGLFRQKGTSANGAASSASPNASASASSSQSHECERIEPAHPDVLKRGGKRSEPTSGPSSLEPHHDGKRLRAGGEGRTWGHPDDERSLHQLVGVGMFEVSGGRDELACGAALVHKYETEQHQERVTELECSVSELVDSWLVTEPSQKRDAESEYDEALDTDDLVDSWLSL